ncbi:MAG: DUF4271 domain-containing protein [Bacteroidales bacterium]|nr:DUF4271 domain-containing protein [Bacteroidales bacterium]
MDCHSLLEIVPKEIPSKGIFYDLLAVLFAVILLLFALVVVQGRRKFSLICRSLYSPRYRSQLLRESKPLQEWIYFFLILYAILVQGAFCFVLLEQFFPLLYEKIPPVLLLLSCIGAVATDVFLKRIAIYILSVAFECTDDGQTYAQTKFFYRLNNALLLLPLLLVAVYTHILWVLVAYAVIVITHLFLLVFRTVTLKSQQLGLFQFFLYFCTLEILPYLIVVKLIILNS